MQRCKLECYVPHITVTEKRNLLGDSRVYEDQRVGTRGAGCVAVHTLAIIHTRGGGNLRERAISCKQGALLIEIVFDHAVYAIICGKLVKFHNIIPGLITCV